MWSAAFRGLSESGDRAAGRGVPWGSGRAGRLEELDTTRHILRRQQVVDHDKPAKHFPHGNRLLLAIGYPGMGQALHMKPEEVVVLSHYDAP
jgi:hypothetical protein